MILKKYKKYRFKIKNIGVYQKNIDNLNHLIKFGENYKFKKMAGVKESLRSVFLTGVLIIASGFTGYSQTKEERPTNVNIDFASSYIWRGLKLGSGPAVQPLLEWRKGIFTVGAWGSFDFRGYEEVDLYIVFSLSSGFSLGLTDYYSPELRYFDYSRESGSHAIEMNLLYEGEKLKLSANYIFNQAGGIGSYGNDLYFEAGYSFSSFLLFAGAGNGWLTADTDDDPKFELCNIGLEATSTIKITETFSLPITGRLIFNPSSERLYLTGFISF